MKRKIESKHLPKGKNSSEEPVRLNKYISSAGFCSRREADMLITDGRVKVNGNIVTELGVKVKPKDLVTVDNKKIELKQKNVYILLNKPKGYISTTKDEKGRKTVMELVSKATSERVYPVGRLDRNTTGLLLLTNDGELTQAFLHPSMEVSKIYSLKLNRPLTKADYIKIMEGIELEDGTIQPDELSYINEKDKSELGIRIHSGRNRIVRRIFETLEYEIEKLDRVQFGILTKRDLPRGKWRLLSEREVRILKTSMGISSRV